MSTVCVCVCVRACVCAYACVCTCVCEYTCAWCVRVCDHITAGPTPQEAPPTSSMTAVVQEVRSLMPCWAMSIKSLAVWSVRAKSRLVMICGGKETSDPQEL